MESSDTYGTVSRCRILHKSSRRPSGKKDGRGGIEAGCQEMKVGDRSWTRTLGQSLTEVATGGEQLL